LNLDIVLVGAREILEYIPSANSIQSYIVNREAANHDSGYPIEYITKNGIF
jgi:hypothetical protein